MEIRPVQHNIIFLTTSFRNCGPNQQLLNIVRYLRKRDIQVSVLAVHERKNDLKGSFVQSGAEINVLIRKWTDIIGVLLKFRNIVTENRPIAVQSHGFLPDVFMSVLPSWLPVFSTVRNSPFEDYQQKYGRIIGSFLAGVHILALKGRARVISCSRHIQKEVRKYGIKSIVIRNGVDADRVEKQGENSKLGELREVFDSGIRFVTFSSLLPRKRIDLLLRSFANAPLSDEAQLMLIGDGPLMEFCKATASPNVYLQGHVANPSNYFLPDHVFISLSNSEGMPNSVLEALVAGLPCVLSDIPPHQEIFDLMPDSVRLVDCGDNDEVLAARIFEDAKRLMSASRCKTREKALELFSASATSRQYLRLYGCNLAETSALYE